MVSVNKTIVGGLKQDYNFSKTIKKQAREGRLFASFPCLFLHLFYFACSLTRAHPINQGD